MDFSNTKFDIIIVAGQSNAQGMGLGPADEALLPRNTGNVYQIEAEREIAVFEDHMEITYPNKPFVLGPVKENEENGVPHASFANSFADEYEKSGLLESDRKILLVRAAIGGTGFKKNNWGIGKQLYSKLVELTDYALNMNSENRVVAFLWHQGEHDAFEKNDPDVFELQLKEMLEDVRMRYGAELPIIAGDFVHEWKVLFQEDCDNILKKIKKVLSEIGGTGFVETADLLSNNQKLQNGDNIHFCRESVCILGRRYFEEYMKISKSV